MAKTMRSVDTRFWVDSWVRKLNKDARYLFLYFLTNSHSSWCGVYELDIEMIAFETGIKQSELTNKLIPQLSPKIICVDGWVAIRNFEKYHANNSEKTKKGIENAWNEVPEYIRVKIKEIEGNKPHLDTPSKKDDGVSPFASASASTSASTPTEGTFRHISFLEKVPPNVLEELSEKHQISQKGIQVKATELLLWCGSEGKTKKNYKMFLERIISGKEKESLQNKYPFEKKVEKPPPPEEITPEQKAKNEALKAKIRDIAQKRSSSLTT